MKTILAVILLVICNASQAATLKDTFVNKDGDKICVYEKHFKEVYVNAGFSGHCPFNVSDSELE